MPYSDTSPNVDNYYVGKGIIKWKGEDDIAYRDVGNCPLFELTPTVRMLDHFSARQGVKFKDLAVVQEKTAVVKMHMEEFTAKNLTMMLLGVETPGSPISIDILSKSEIRGALRFIGTNEVGPKVQMDLPRVTLSPSAALNLIADSWGMIEIQGEVNGDPSTGSFGTVLWGITTEVN